MTGRDRMVLMAVIVVAILGAGWVLVVSPERNKANSIGTDVTTAQASLATAEGELSKARAAQSQYAAAYSSIVNLGKAVPAEKEVPSLIVQLARASEQKSVFFSSISSGSSSASASTVATTAAAGFTAMPFSFVFDGSFFDLEKLMRKLTSFTTRTASGALKVDGRLLTIQSVNLTPSHTEVVGSGSKASSELTGTVTASAYVLPGGQSVTGSSPVPGAGTPSSTSSTTGASSSPTAPATVSVTP
jgi:Tfp pilus assembly protein PilO